MSEDSWLSQLYERDYALLYRVGRVFLGADSAMEALIEDQIQEAFIRAWQKRDALKKHPNPDGWLVECFRRCLTNACRKQTREWRRAAFSADAQDAPPLQDTARPSPEDYVKSREQVALLRRLLGDRNAEIFLRCCVYGEKSAVLAAEMGVSEEAVRMRVSRLKKKILKNSHLFACLAALCLLGLR